MLLTLKLQPAAFELQDTPPQRFAERLPLQARRAALAPARDSLFDSDEILDLGDTRLAPVPRPPKPVAVPREDAVRLATKLRLSLNDNEQVLLFTGAADDGAASEVAADVANALAGMTNEAVLLIDAKLHAPTLHETFNAPASPGLVEALDESFMHYQCLHTTNVRNLTLLPVGTHDAGNSTLSASSLNTLLRTMRRLFRFIVVDASPLLVSSDAVVVAAESDGVVIVLPSNNHRRDELINIKRELDSLHRRTLGVVLCEPTRNKGRSGAARSQQSARDARRLKR